MASYDYDLFVIGAGSGGVRASRIAASHGARVAVAEEFRYGGTCVNRGCIPKKILMYAASFREHSEDAEGYGWSVGDVKLDWEHLMAVKAKEIDRLEAIYGRILGNANVTMINGRARIVDEHTVSVGEQRITAGRILVCVGGKPFVPPMPGQEHLITSNELLELPAKPSSALILGGGFIACEFASILNMFGGVRVKQAYRGAEILRGFDMDVRTHTRAEMIKRGVDVVVNTTVKSVVKQDDGTFLVAFNQEGSEPEVFDVVVACTGRVPLTEDLGLETVGVKTSEDGAIVVNDFYETNVRSIYAIGDVTNRINLTPVALNEGLIFADTIWGNKARLLNYSTVASAVFCTPQIGTCGLTEEAAAERFGKVDVYISKFKPMVYTLTPRTSQTLMKLVVNSHTGVVVGAHIVGPAAAETMQMCAVAMTCGATKTQFDQTVGIHPTSAEEMVTMRTLTRTTARAI